MDLSLYCVIKTLQCFYPDDVIAGEKLWPEVQILFLQGTNVALPISYMPSQPAKLSYYVTPDSQVVAPMVTKNLKKFKAMQEELL